MKIILMSEGTKKSIDERMNILDTHLTRVEKATDGLEVQDRLNSTLVSQVDLFALQ